MITFDYLKNIANILKSNNVDFDGMDIIYTISNNDHELLNRELYYIKNGSNKGLVMSNLINIKIGNINFIIKKENM